MGWNPLVVSLLALSALPGTSACAAGTGPSAPICPSNKVAVVAAENFWGSIAAQLGGDRTCVVSIVSNPATDPHEYDATPADARAVARARYVVENGAGYDPWMPKLLGANPVAGRLVLDAGALVGVEAGHNPHLWYSPGYVLEVVDRITADYIALDPADAAVFDERNLAYKTAGLRDYEAAIGAIKQRYSGVPVGASESIFAYLADATGLDLVTPRGYMTAISEGSDPSAADRSVVEQQLTSRQVRIFVYNRQNSTPEVRSVLDKARRAGVPVVSITETLTPANVAFQEWQTNQLKALLEALGG